MEIEGSIANPQIDIYVDGQLYQSVAFTTNIQNYEKFLYGTKENEFYINKQNTDGTLTSLFNLDVINFNNDNVIRIPRNRSCEIVLSADNDITKGQVTILVYYKAI